MNHHYTPAEVAEVLVKHAPKTIYALLEPSVGQGDLLKPFLNKLYRRSNKVVCIDTDQIVLDKLKENFGPVLGKSLHIVNDDFLKWSSNVSPDQAGSFDCIVMNPPYSGRIKDMVKLNLAEEFPNMGKGVYSVPVEVAFVIRALRLLKANGKMLAVVPATLISSIKTNWLRKYMFEIGSIDYVHELPKFTFESVESRVYLFVFKKAGKQKPLIVSNHDLLTPVRMVIKKNDLPHITRLDYSFHHASMWYQNFKVKFQNLHWTKLNEIASIYRGRIESPSGARHAIHTNNHCDGFWQIGSSGKKLIKDNTERGIHKGDLLIKRIGRRCSQSIGRTIDLEGYACSDCVLIIRSKNWNMNLKLSFALRFLLCCDKGAKLLERGTGATYITEKDLANLYVPIYLYRENPDLYAKYKYSVAKQKFAAMKDIEQQARQIYMYSNPEEN